MIPRALTIAGSDCSGGAGLQADLKTFTAFGVFGTSAVTAVVAENTVGVQSIHYVPADMVATQIRSVLDDIGADAVKLGMLSRPEVVTAVAAELRRYGIPRIVLDPVMVAKSGVPLLSVEARLLLKEELLPLAMVVTPNIPEAEVLLDRRIETMDDMKQAAVEIRALGPGWVVVKGGHRGDEREAVDVVFDGSEHHLLSAPFFNTPNTHGTGCTFSAAITAGLARGDAPLTAIQTAKQFITEAVRTALPLGTGRGPTNHFVRMKTGW